MKFLRIWLASLLLLITTFSFSQVFGNNGVVWTLDWIDTENIVCQAQGDPDISSGHTVINWATLEEDWLRIEYFTGSMTIYTDYISTHTSLLHGKTTFRYVLTNGTAPTHVNWAGSTFVSWEGANSNGLYGASVANGLFDTVPRTHILGSGYYEWFYNTEPCFFDWESYHGSTPYSDEDVWFSDVEIPLIACQTTTQAQTSVGSSVGSAYAETKEQINVTVINKPCWHVVLPEPDFPPVVPIVALVTSPSKEKRLVINSDYEFGGQMEDANTHDIYIRAHSALWKKYTSVQFSATTDLDLGTYTPIYGDIDGDNSITVFDLSYVDDHFDASVEDEDWYVKDAYGISAFDCDLDCDGSITVFDYGIVSDNFDLSGDELP